MEEILAFLNSGMDGCLEVEAIAGDDDIQLLASFADLVDKAFARVGFTILLFVTITFWIGSGKPSRGTHRVRSCEYPGSSISRLHQ